MLQAVELFGGIQQGFRGYATNVQAGSTQGGPSLSVLEFIDAGGVETELRAANRGYVTCRTRSDHHNVIAVCHVKASVVFLSV